MLNTLPKDLVFSIPIDVQLGFLAPGNFDGFSGSFKGRFDNCEGEDILGNWHFLTYFEMSRTNWSICCWTGLGAFTSLITCSSIESSTSRKPKPEEQ